MLETNHQALLAEVDSLKGDVQDRDDTIAKLETVIDEAREEAKSYANALQEHLLLGNVDDLIEQAKKNPDGDVYICPSLFEKVNT